MKVFVLLIFLLIPLVSATTEQVVIGDAQGNVFFGWEPTQEIIEIEEEVIEEKQNTFSNRYFFNLFPKYSPKLYTQVHANETYGFHHT